ncbi:MAG: LacI family DNA-binding transcriptional regulator [Deinococcota bacterium]
MAITISDLARHVGLSISTVSKALNDYPDVAEETRQTVLEASRDLNYQPRSAARMLRLQKTEKLGIVHPLKSYESEAFIALFRGVARGAERHGYSLILYTATQDDELDTSDRLARICQAREVDGIVVMSLGIDGAKELQASLDILAAETLPYVVLGQPVLGKSGIEESGLEQGAQAHLNLPQPPSCEQLAPVAYVAADNIAGARALTEHLLAQGHKRFAYLSRSDDVYNNLERLTGIQQALAAASLTLDMIFDAPYAAYTGRAAMQQVLASSVLPTAVIAFNDHIAIDAMYVAQAGGLRVPDDIAIAGFDDIPSASIVTPALTTTHIPMVTMGEYAAELLLEQLTATAPLPPARLQKIFTTDLVVRTSTQIDADGRFNLTK